MKAKRTKFLTVLLCGLVALFVASCSAKEPASATNAPAAPAANNSNAAAPATPDGPLTPYAEPITITWGVQASAVQEFFDGDTYDNNRWSRRIKDELNIDLKVAFSADITTDAYRNKVNALLATGDLPDVMRW
ncbi:MAG: hypothetical protein LBT59_23750, partial [Clostridiales bacterium]|nr:hypothetical protein [Clostridiales bacterium]